MPKQNLSHGGLAHDECEWLFHERQMNRRHAPNGEEEGGQEIALAARPFVSGLELPLARDERRLMHLFDYSRKNAPAAE